MLKGGNMKLRNLLSALCMSMSVVVMTQENPIEKMEGYGLGQRTGGLRPGPRPDGPRLGDLKTPVTLLDQQKTAMVINGLQADLELEGRPESLQRNFKSLTPLTQRLTTLRNKLPSGIAQVDIRETIEHLLEAMNAFDVHTKASVLLGAYDLSSLVRTGDEWSLQKQLADLLVYFLHKAQTLRALALPIRVDRRSGELADQAASEAAYYYQLAYNLAQALLIRGMNSAQTSQGQIITLSTSKEQAKMALKSLRYPLPQASQDAFKALVPPTLLLLQ
jgi:hypothetical protein